MFYPSQCVLYSEGVAYNLVVFLCSLWYCEAVSGGEGVPERHPLLLDKALKARDGAIVRICHQLNQR